MRAGISATSVDTEHDATETVDGAPRAVVHDQHFTVAELRVAVDVRASRRWGLWAMLGQRLVDTDIVYRDATTRIPVAIANPDVHHRTEQVGGITDPQLGARVRLAAGAVVLAGRLGVSVPLGRTEADPFALGDAGLPHQHVQLGTGTFGVIAGVDAHRGIGRWAIGGYAQTTQFLTENGHGYHAGDRYGVGAAVTTPMVVGRLRGRVTVDLAGETAERWQKMVHTTDGNQGRVDVLAGGSVEIGIGRGLQVDLGIKVPVYSHVVGGQLDYPFIGEIGVAWALDRPAEHDHDHHDHHDDDHHDHDEPVATGGDVVDLGPPGAAIELVPVAGKVTVFDYWAKWCVPCDELERGLRQLAAKYPELAIRRIDVVDWDSAIVARDLTPGKFGMPHVKIVAADGSVVAETSDGVTRILERVRSALGR